MVRPLRFAGLAAALALVAQAASAAPLSVGFYLPWDAASQASLTAHAAALQVASPMSAAVDTPQGHVRWQPDPALPMALAAVRTAGKTAPKVFPIVSNAHDNVWDAAAAEAVMTDPTATHAVIAELTAKAAAQDYGGYVLDFETLTPRGLAAYAPFLRQLHAALRAMHRELWVTALFSTDPATLRALAQATDAVVLMAYDQCWATSTPGPIAGVDWLTTKLDASLHDLDPAHVVVALGAYGYDWPAGGPAQVVSAPEAAARAKAHGAAVARNVPDATPHAAYTGDDGRAHEVWWLDAGVFAAQRELAVAHRVRGVAIWRLGLEDPAVWRKPGPPPALGLGPLAGACVLAAH